MITVIAIVGKKRSGKDTASDYLEKRYGVEKAQKLAYPIKEIGKLMFGWSTEMVEGIDYDREQVIEELGMSVRQFLQECGSLFKYDLSRILPEYGKKVGAKVWAKNLVNWLKERDVDTFSSIYSVSDVRFPEEVEEIGNSFKLYVIKLVSDRSPEDHHISETACDNIPADVVITNDGTNTQEELYKNLDIAMDMIQREVFK